jgi:hypothetical protein
VNVRAVAIGIAVVVCGLIGLRALADATLTTHVSMDPDSQMTMVLHGNRGEEAEHDLPSQLESLAHYCQLEVEAAIVPDRTEVLGADRIRVVFQPALDDADQRQFRGCVSDLRVDHLQASVEEIAEVQG